MQSKSNAGLPLYIARARLWGNSHVIALPTDLRQQLGIVDGSLIAIRLNAPYATFRVWPPPHVPDPHTLKPEQLPPSSEESKRRA